VSKPADSAPLKVVPLGDGRYQVEEGLQRRLAFAVAARDTWVFLDGRVYVIPAAEAGARPVARDDATALAAPMPATVLSIEVTAGQTVTRDTVLVMLEAMKMELPIKAPRDGRVIAITCRPGEIVQPGVRLIEFE
jgi:3-methylcrotonyl-CoA carboxylase alpha subunit